LNEKGSVVFSLLLRKSKNKKRFLTAIFLIYGVVVGWVFGKRGKKKKEAIHINKNLFSFLLNSRSVVCGEIEKKKFLYQQKK